MAGIKEQAQLHRSVASFFLTCNWQSILIASNAIGVGDWLDMMNVGLNRVVQDIAHEKHEWPVMSNIVTKRKLLGDCSSVQ
jgi:hypothetical protein